MARIALPGTQNESRREISARASRLPLSDSGAEISRYGIGSDWGGFSPSSYLAMGGRPAFGSRPAFWSEGDLQAKPAAETGGVREQAGTVGSSEYLSVGARQSNIKANLDPATATAVSTALISASPALPSMPTNTGPSISSRKTPT